MANKCQLVAENASLEVEVTGFVDDERVIIEKVTERRNGVDATYHRYYYMVFDQTRKHGFYAYSDLTPEDFTRQYGLGDQDGAVLRGVWEATPGDVRVKEPISGINKRELVGPGEIETVIERLRAYRQRYPLRIDRRLNLMASRWKVEHGVNLAVMGVYFLAGLGLMWLGFRQRGESSPRNGHPG